MPPENGLHETIEENVLGFWWPKTFPHAPIHIGIVVPEKGDFKNTIVE